MKLSQKVATEVGRAIVNAIGDDLWKAVDKEVFEQLESTEQDPIYVHYDKESKGFYATASLYQGNFVVTYDVRLPDPMTYFPARADYSHQVEECQSIIDGLVALADAAMGAAKEAQERLDAFTGKSSEQNKAEG